MSSAGRSWAAASAGWWRPCIRDHRDPGGPAREHGTMVVPRAAGREGSARGTPCPTEPTLRRAALPLEREDRYLAPRRPNGHGHDGDRDPDALDDAGARQTRRVRAAGRTGAGC